MNTSFGLPSVSEQPLHTQDAHLESVLEIIKQKATDKLIVNYNTNQSIEINDSKDFEYLNELVKAGKIDLTKIQAIIVVDAAGKHSDEEAKKIIDSLLSYLTENENKLTSLRSLKLCKEYRGHLIIPTFAFELKELQIGKVISLTIKSQPKLEGITIDHVYNNLIIEKQNELKDLCMHCIEQGEKGAQIAIQPKLSSLQINVCTGDLSLENQPSLGKFEIKRFWAGLLIITKEQRALLNAPACYDPCLGSAMIMITKSKIELAKPVPMSHLLTLGHLRSVVTINNRIYLAAALFEAIRSPYVINLLADVLKSIADSNFVTNFALQQSYMACQAFLASVIASISNLPLVTFAFENPTIIYVGCSLLILVNIVKEMQRIYSNEKAMMYLYF